MGKKREEVEIKVVYVKTPGDEIESLIEALSPNIRSTLSKYGATLTMDLGEIMRKHASGGNVNA